MPARTIEASCRQRRPAGLLPHQDVSALQRVKRFAGFTLNSPVASRSPDALNNSIELASLNVLHICYLSIFPLPSEYHHNGRCPGASTASRSPHPPRYRASRPCFVLILVTQNRYTRASKRSILREDIYLTAVPVCISHHNPCFLPTDTTCHSLELFQVKPLLWSAPIERGTPLGLPTPARRSSRR
jgi:hypothetical protein